MDTKRCALMRQTWYEAARKRMKDGERLAFYEMCYEYEFYGKMPEEDLFNFDGALLLFEVVKDTLDADRDKADNIALRNRRNGMLGGRPRKSDQEASAAPEDLSNLTNPKKPRQNPDNPNGNFGVYTTLHYTTEQDKSLNRSLSLRKRKRHTDTERYERFCVMFVFFCAGSPDPAAETELFYNYYGARDWRASGGVVIKDRVKLAQTWDVKNSSPGLLAARDIYAGLIRALDPEEPELLTDFVAMVKNDADKRVTIRMRRSTAVQDILEKTYIAPLSVYFRDVLKLDGYNLFYEIDRSL